MQFARFTALSVLSNWGWYSPQEQALLAQERQLASDLNGLEDFMRAKPLVSRLIKKFRAIQLNNAVEEKDYAALAVQMRRMIESIRLFRLHTLNLGGADVPDAPRAFKNRLPDALIAEREAYRQYKKENKDAHNPFSRGFRVSFGRDKLGKLGFHEIMESGGKVLYTLDVDDVLSIGDPKSTKHSVVAKGKDCKAAGIAQLELDDKKDMYLSMKDHERKAAHFKQKVQEGGGNVSEYRENMTYYEKAAEELAKMLCGYVPPVNNSKTVLIDFDSGHYHPEQAWKEAMTGWRKAGYTAKWNPDSRRV